MADFVQGLDASKLILTEAVSIHTFHGILGPCNTVIYRPSHSSLARSVPLRTTYPFFSLGYMYKGAKKPLRTHSKL